MAKFAQYSTNIVQKCIDEKDSRIVFWRNISKTNSRNIMPVICTIETYSRKEQLKYTEGIYIYKGEIYRNMYKNKAELDCKNLYKKYTTTSKSRNI